MIVGLSNTKISRKINILAIVIILAIGGFYIATIREGHDWGGDFAAYIHHAKNIIEGTDYKDIGWIYDPSRLALEPKTYPPIFPLILSPIYKWFGLNLTAMKIEIVLTFLFSLFIIFWTFRNELSPRYNITMIVLIGFSPYFWGFKDTILSDIPFLFFTYLSLSLIHKAYRSYKSQKPQLLYAILIGLLIYLSYGTRTIGIIFIPSLFIYSAIRFRRKTLFAIIAIFIFSFLAILQNLIFHWEKSYFHIFLELVSFKTIFHNLLSYPKFLSAILGGGYNKICRYILFLITSGLAIIGYLTRIKNEITIFEVFSLLYVLFIILFPLTQGIRFLIPLIPLYVFYIFKGSSTIDCFQRGKQIKKFGLGLLIIIIFISYTGQYTKSAWGFIPEGVSKKESINLFNYIKEKTAESDIFIFFKPRVLSLFTGRKTAGYPYFKNDSGLWNYFRDINATYIILGPFDSAFLQSFIKRHRDNFQEEYANSDFKIYKINYGLL